MFMKNLIRLITVLIAISFSFNASAFIKKDGVSDYKESYKSQKYEMPKKTFVYEKCWIGCGKSQKTNVDITFIPEIYTGQDLKNAIAQLRTILISTKMNHETHYPGCGHKDEPGTPTTDVPEPGILGLIAIGLLGMVLVRRKKSV